MFKLDHMFEKKNCYFKQYTGCPRIFDALWYSYKLNSVLPKLVNCRSNKK